MRVVSVIGVEGFKESRRESRGLCLREAGGIRSCLNIRPGNEVVSGSIEVRRRGGLKSD